jgi:dipeptidase
MTWERNGGQYTWERPISTQQTGFSMVGQARAFLPDAIGGVLWYGVDDTYFTCYVPLYCGITDVPRSFTYGSLQEFSWDSAWWVFNFVSNYANLKYSYMIEDIRAVQKELEDSFLAARPAIEKAAVELARTDPALTRAFLTEYSVGRGEHVVRRWRELAEHLLVKYNDGYVKDEEGEPQEVGYPEVWLRDVLKLRPEQFRLESWGQDTLETELPY